MTSHTVECIRYNDFVAVPSLPQPAIDVVDQQQQQRRSSPQTGRTRNFLRPRNQQQQRRPRSLAVTTSSVDTVTNSDADSAGGNLSTTSTLENDAVQAEIRGSAVVVESTELESLSVDNQVTLRRPAAAGTKRTRKRLSNFFERLRRRPDNDHVSSSSAAAAEQLAVEVDDDEVGRLFGQPVNALFESDGTPHNALMLILSCLWHHGAKTEGIFRKSPNTRECNEIKSLLDAGIQVSSADIRPTVAATLLSQLLRQMPDCLLTCQLYDDWLLLASLTEHEEIVIQTKHLIGQMPTNHRILLCHVIRVLQHISQNSSSNKMTANNLAVCVTPSIISKRSLPIIMTASRSQQRCNMGSDVSDSKSLVVVVERMILSADEIFDGFDWSESLYGEFVTSLVSQQSKSVSSLDESDAYSEPDRPRSLVSFESQLSVTSIDLMTPSSDGLDASQNGFGLSTTGSLNDSLNVVTSPVARSAASPVPPPRTKKLKRQQAAPLADAVTSPVSESRNRDVTRTTPRCVVTVHKAISNDSLSESFDDRNLTDDYFDINDDVGVQSCGDDVISSAANDNGILHKSTHSLTADLPSERRVPAAAGRLSVSGTRSRSMQRRSSVPVPANEVQSDSVLLQQPTVNGKPQLLYPSKKFHQYSTDSAISISTDVDPTTASNVSLFPSDIVTSNETVTSNPVPSLHRANSNVTGGEISARQKSMGQGHVVNKRSGMTSSGGDLFCPLRRSTTAIVDCTPMEAFHDVQLSRDQSSSIRSAASAKTTQEQEIRTEHKSRNKIQPATPARLGRMFQRVNGSSSSNSSDSCVDYTSDFEDFKDDDDDSKFRRRRVYQRRSYNAMSRQPNKKQTTAINRSQSDSTRLITHKHRLQKQKAIDINTKSPLRGQTIEGKTELGSTSDVTVTESNSEALPAPSIEVDETANRPTMPEVSFALVESSKAVGVGAKKQMDDGVRVLTSSRRVSLLPASNNDGVDVQANRHGENVCTDGIDMSADLQTKADIVTTMTSQCNISGMVPPSRLQLLSSGGSSVKRIANEATSGARVGCGPVKVKDHDWHRDLVQEYKDYQYPASVAGHCTVARRHSDSFQIARSSTTTSSSSSTLLHKAPQFGSQHSRLSSSWSSVPRRDVTSDGERRESTVNRSSTESSKIVEKTIPSRDETDSVQTPPTFQTGLVRSVGLKIDDVTVQVRPAKFGGATLSDVGKAVANDRNDDSIDRCTAGPLSTSETIAVPPLIMLRHDSLQRRHSHKSERTDSSKTDDATSRSNVRSVSWSVASLKSVFDTKNY